MLVLSRRHKERIILKGDYEVMITVFVISDNKVRIGIEAPKHIRIDRAELQRRSTNKTKSENP